MGDENRAAAESTLADVAHAARVSAATASRYFSAPEKLAEATRERVRLAVEALGYVPNLLAGALASSRTGLIAVVVPEVERSIFPATIQAMADELNREGYSVILGLTGPYDERMEEALLSVLGRRPDGVILTGLVTAERQRAWLRSAGVPIIETWDLPPDPIDRVVGFSHRAVGQALAERVLATGRRNPVLVSARGRRAAERCRGFVEVFTARGLPEPRRLYADGPTTLRYGREALARLLDGGPRPDAIVCSSDWTALGVLVEARARGLRAPDDFAVLGFGDLEFAADADPPLTTVRIDGVAIAREAVRMLVAGAQGRGMRAETEFELVVRDSG